jgi:hypothetical protein
LVPRCADYETFAEIKNLIFDYMVKSFITNICLLWFGTFFCRKLLTISTDRGHLRANFIKFLTFAKISKLAHLSLFSRQVNNFQLSAYVLCWFSNSHSFQQNNFSLSLQDHYSFAQNCFSVTHFFPHQSIKN